MAKTTKKRPKRFTKAQIKQALDLSQKQKIESLEDKIYAKSCEISYLQTDLIFAKEDKKIAFLLGALAPSVVWVCLHFLI